MVFKLLRLNIDVADEDINAIYPEKIRRLARQHWTPIGVAKRAAEFLADKPGTRVLDIGSGAGKFCLVGAAYSRGHFTGVEQRGKLVALSDKLANIYNIRNVSFIHQNITAINFSNYDAFYFYNSFHENIDMPNKIDDSIKLGADLYHQYSTYIVDQFVALPVGARLVTYCSPTTIVPSTFKLQDASNGGLLKFWEKVDNWNPSCSEN
jgi:SAM-dependent methyltransferase